MTGPFVAMLKTEKLLPRRATSSVSETSWWPSVSCAGKEPTVSEAGPTVVASIGVPMTPIVCIVLSPSPAPGGGIHHPSGSLPSDLLRRLGMGGTAPYPGMATAPGWTRESTVETAVGWKPSSFLLPVTATAPMNGRIGSRLIGAKDSPSTPSL
eukprot:CAMPEP_0113595936 /NCGR_PEP_ID=MMETSP0015_2-20120614/40036_1 /TAXON_ID=2838 /ORGANISM="Odontella" /LENGTH=153 /DNA_ID=CAMNT_0000503353 /DNA_START=306 /DNA_END=767 /DNA_ORIENTATION=+ /assembly_acc=CAM_ASM_000160